MGPSARDENLTSSNSRAQAAIRALGSIVEMGPDQVIFLRGDRDTRVFMVESGSVRLSMDVGHGHEIILAEVGPAAVVGSVSALDGLPRPATATTLTPARLVEVPGDRFRNALEKDPSLASFMLSELSREVRRSVGQLAVRCGMSTRARVAGQLLSMQQRRERADGRVQITQGALADWVGATRESTARALGELRAEGAITTGRGWVRVLDRRALARSLG